MFLKYAISRFNHEQKEMAYMVYMTDTLYYKAKNQMINTRFVDMIEQKNVDNRTGDEIALDIIKKAGLKVE